MPEQPLPPFIAERTWICDASGREVLTCATRLDGDAAEIEFAQRVAASLNLAAELSTLTDTECDFADGFELREAGRATLQGRFLASRPIYTAEEERRAVDAIRARYDPENSFASRKSTAVRPAALVELVAEALGLRKAGA